MELAQVEFSCNTQVMETADAAMLDPQQNLIVMSTFISSQVNQNQQFIAIPWKWSRLDVTTTHIEEISTVMVQQIHSHVLTISKD